VTEDFVDAVNHEIGHLSQEYRQWRRQTDGAAIKSNQIKYFSVQEDAK